MPSHCWFQSTHSITECDLWNSNNIDIFVIFQSTHSITECDLRVHKLRWRTCHFNPRTPLQSAIYDRCNYSWYHQHFNPRTPLQSAMGDLGALGPNETDFNPRTPLQSAITENRITITTRVIISIHALHYRVRCYTSQPVDGFHLHFNPRTPLQSAIPSIFWA